MSDDRHGGWIERCAGRVAGAMPSRQPESFIFVLGASGSLASLVGAALSTFVEGQPDWETAGVLTAQAALFAGAFGLLRSGRVATAAWTLMLTALAGTTLLILTGSTSGYDDIAIMLYAVLAIGAAVLFASRAFAIALSLVLASLVGILVADLSGGGSADRPGSVVADFGFAALIVLVTGLGSHFLASRLRYSISERERQEDALWQANLELESRAVEREGLIRELEMRNSELERFAYTISHELKSPLVTIGGFLTYFRKSVEAGDGEAAQLAFARIHQAHDRMARLLSELLDLCRVGFVHDPAEDVRLGDVVNEARAASETVLSDAGLRIEVASDLPSVRGDRRRLVEVFQNLLENAARFTNGERRPRLEIGSRRDRAGTVVFVRDNGIGIDPAHHEAVFELFHKLNPGDLGTGVGLAIVRRIVERHEGRIWVESEGLGSGSTFCISLPWAHEARLDAAET